VASQAIGILANIAKIIGSPKGAMAAYTNGTIATTIVPYVPVVR
jgi:hypothetical protein